MDSRAHVAAGAQRSRKDEPCLADNFGAHTYGKIDRVGAPDTL